MEDKKMLSYIQDVIENMPADWSNLTTHRLDIYEEKLAKTQFLEQFESLFNDYNSGSKNIATSLKELPTAYDYIRLGHPLSCVLEWAIAKSNHLDPKNAISFSSKTIPILAILRKNLLDHKYTQIFYTGELPDVLDIDVLKRIYGYRFDLVPVKKAEEISKLINLKDPSRGSTLFISQRDDFAHHDLPFPSEIANDIDFYVRIHSQLGSILLINSGANHRSGQLNESYISDIQHVRRRETIAMTPANCLTALKSLIDPSSFDNSQSNVESNKNESNKNLVLDSIKEITGVDTKPLLGSSGLSIQYAIMMGLIHDAVEKHAGKAIKFIVPTNCYGGTNDQARRVAACLDKVEIVDLLVDSGHDMAQSLDTVLEKIAKEDAVPYIIAEIPTNPRVEVPDLINLKAVLSKQRKTEGGDVAIDPVFILDQTFCPNVHFLGEGKILSTVRTIAYVSGSKFPSGGKCTAGYCVGNKKSEALIEKIALHLWLCDNEATALQIEILAKQMPSMNQRIFDAYQNTRAFVNFINETLPEAKINFVSEELAQQGFTPSVFSLDLPTKGSTEEERETNKRALNLKLIHLMITKIPHESKFCVSYGQLKGCYWTVPATSTQGTTKEGDKDYIVRVSLSPDMDLELHKEVFSEFIGSM